MLTLSTDQQNRVKRFLQAFNRIEKLLQRKLNQESENTSFRALVDMMEDKNLITRENARFLQRCRELRNNLVHNNINGYMSIPHEDVVITIEEVHHALENPPLVINYFQKEVECISDDEMLYTVLQVVHECAYSQFPVYDSSDTFVGLLTENGITRWLANHVHIKKIELADLEETVRDALAVQEDFTNYAFVPREMTITEALNVYAVNPQLEALLITEHGKAQQSLLGIMTRTDALDIIDGELNKDF